MVRERRGCNRTELSSLTQLTMGKNAFTFKDVSGSSLLLKGEGRLNGVMNRLAASGITHHSRRKQHVVPIPA